MGVSSINTLLCSHKTGFLPSANELHICVVVILQFYELLCSGVAAAVRFRVLLF